MLEFAYQDETTLVDFVANDDPLGPLRDEEGAHGEVEVNVGHDQVDEEDEIEDNVADDEEKEFDFDNMKTLNWIDCLMMMRMIMMISMMISLLFILCQR